MSNSYSETLVAEALAEAVNRTGLSLASEPRRVHGMISDSLGSEGRTRRIEIDAVVLAAQERIADDLIAGRLQPEGAVDVLTAKGLDAGIAQFAVDVWLYAMGLMGAEAEAPTLTKSVESATAAKSSESGLTSTGGASSDEVGLESSGAHSSNTTNENGAGDWRTVIPSEVHQSGETFGNEASGNEVVELHERIPAGQEEDTGLNSNEGSLKVTGLHTASSAGVSKEAGVVESPRSAPGTTKSRRPLIFAGAAALVLIAVAAIALVISGGDDSDDIAAGPAEKTKAQAVSTKFAAQPGHLGTVERAWVVEDGSLEGIVKITNNSAKAVKGTHYEVIPKAVAKSAASITSSPKFRIVKDDPVIAWDLTLKAGKSITLTYKVKVPDKVSAQQLTDWKTAQIDETKEFAKEVSAKPALRITSPTAVITTSSSTILEGTTAPDAKITVAGVSPKVAANGAWTQLLTGLKPGTHSVVVVATSPYGVATKASVRIAVVDPQVAATTTTTTTTAVQSENRKPTEKVVSKPGTTTTAAPVAPKKPTPTTAAPKPISISISGNRSVWDLESFCYYTYYIHPVGFTPTSVTWSAPAKVDLYKGYEYAFSPNSVAPGNYKITVTATAPDGRKVSASKSIKIIINPDGSCVDT